jgi:transposase InsO family protein
VTRYRCVADRKAEGFNVTAACDAAGVSRSSFYNRQRRHSSLGNISPAEHERRWQPAHEQAA